MTFVFDLGGVLADLDVHGFIERLRALMDADSELGASVEELTSGGGDSFLHEYELGHILTEECLKCFHRLCRPEVTDEDIRQVWLSELKPVKESVKQLILRLRREGHKVFMLSNTNDMHWQYIKPMFEEKGHKLEDYFNKVFLSFDKGMIKPHKEVFDEVEKYIEEKEEVVYIDDAEKNRLQGEKHGWVTFSSIEECLKSLDLCSKTSIGGGV